VITKAAITCLLLSLMSTCTGKREKPEPPAPAVEPLRYSDPYELARDALEAYRARNVETYSRLLLDPPSKPDDAFRMTLEDEDRIQGLYFLDEGKTIAAIVRTARSDLPAVWFRLVRTDKGFAVEKLLVTERTPPTERPVEGG
jgi:hypothetical protein